MGARITQAGAEALALGSVEGVTRATHAGVEVLALGVTQGVARVTRAGVEALLSGTGDGAARITVAGCEVVLAGLAQGLARVAASGVEVVHEDWAPYGLEEPAHCGLYTTADGQVAVPVSFVPAGSTTRVEYATGAAAPHPASTGWTLLGQATGEETLTSPPLPPGTTVWVRMRTQQIGGAMGSWTQPDGITV